MRKMGGRGLGSGRGMHEGCCAGLAGGVLMAVIKDTIHGTRAGREMHFSATGAGKWR